MDIGRSWALIDRTALRLENILGIFLYKETRFRGGIMSTHYEFWVIDDGYRGTNLVFLQAGPAQACYDALTAAAPGAACGGKKEEKAFLEEARKRQQAGAL